MCRCIELAWYSINKISTFDAYLLEFSYEIDAIKIPAIVDAIYIIMESRTEIVIC